MNTESYRDPCSHVYEQDGRIYRRITPAGGADYDLLMSSGLYQVLTNSDMLVRHERLIAATKLIEPERIPFVSYPCEWCFSQLKAAARLTLAIELLALDHGMTLKDASAFNVQFRGCNPVFIDTGSFTRYVEGEPWVAYGQFCRHFLAPLALAAYCDVRLSALWRTYLDGVPLDLASRLLPARTWLKPGLFGHLHLHPRMERRAGSVSGRWRMSTGALRGVLLSLLNNVERMNWTPTRTEWSQYDPAVSYSDEGRTAKMAAVREFAAGCGDGLVWSLGSNLGVHGGLCCDEGRTVVCWDADAAAVELGHQCAAKLRRNSLHLVTDVCNPTPGLGWNGQERRSWFERGPADSVLCLALIHHLAIANNVPLPMLADWLAGITRRHALVEWVDVLDPQVQGLLAARRGVSHVYDRGVYVAEMGRHFRLRQSWPAGRTRVVEWWERR